MTTALTVENIMPSLSLDLRKRIIETYEKGNTSIRKVAQQFQVSKTTVNNLDEMGILLGIMRDMARSLVGTGAYDLDCVYRGKRLKYIGAMSLKGVLSVKRLPKSLDGESFKEYLKEELLPKLGKGAVLVSDNLKAHKVEGVEEMLESAGMKMVYLSRYSPDFNPIEHLWWEIKAFIRRFRPKTEEGVEKLIKIALLLHTPEMTKKYFTNCCYCAT